MAKDGRRVWRGKVLLLLAHYAALAEYQNSEQNAFFPTTKPYAPF
jgi:hypothetical protein